MQLLHLRSKCWSFLFSFLFFHLLQSVRIAVAGAKGFFVVGLIVVRREAHLDNVERIAVDMYGVREAIP